ncbi:MAG: TerB family tellurite resistance protein [Leptolyngbyaceae cyanobacterium MO_188.B28]|nr:TerB family tellurite resistance protein [Leptolyngbyaceae cyanobacterium MO_188.B28]
MMLQTSPSPSISPRQMNIFRIVASMAWCDGSLCGQEADLVLKRLSELFVKEPSQRESMQQELRDYLMQNIPLEELTAKLQTQEEKEVVLKLGYEVIQVSARTPEEAHINEEEAIAYKKLVDLLGVPAEVVQRIEASVNAESKE